MFFIRISAIVLAIILAHSPMVEGRDPPTVELPPFPHWQVPKWLELRGDPRLWDPLGNALNITVNRHRELDREFEQTMGFLQLDSYTEDAADHHFYHLDGLSRRYVRVLKAIADFFANDNMLLDPMVQAYGYDHLCIFDGNYRDMESFIKRFAYSNALLKEWVRIWSTTMSSYVLKYQTDANHALFLRTQRDAYTAVIAAMRRYAIYIDTNLRCPRRPIAFLHMMKRTARAVHALVETLEDVLEDQDAVLNAEALKFAVEGEGAAVLRPDPDLGAFEL